MSTPTPPPNGKKEITTIKVFGAELPLWKTIVPFFSILALLIALWQFYEMKIDPYMEKLERGKMASRQLVEFQRHFAEEATYSQEAVQGKLWVRFYESDGCVLVKRNQVQIWVPNPELIQQSIAPGKITHNHLDIVSTAEAGGGQCMNPHDGTFNQWVGEVRGCWQQVWRQWYDGCKGYAWFDSCNSVWDLQMYWVECYH